MPLNSLCLAGLPVRPWCISLRPPRETGGPAWLATPSQGKQSAPEEAPAAASEADVASARCAGSGGDKAAVDEGALGRRPLQESCGKDDRKERDAPHTEQASSASESLCAGAPDLAFLPEMMQHWGTRSVPEKSIHRLCRWRGGQRLSDQNTPEPIQGRRSPPQTSLRAPQVPPFHITTSLQAWPQLQAERTLCERERKKQKGLKYCKNHSSSPRWGREEMGAGAQSLQSARRGSCRHCGLPAHAWAPQTRMAALCSPAALAPFSHTVKPCRDSLGSHGNITLWQLHSRSSQAKVQPSFH